MTRRTLVVTGYGMVAHRFVEAVCERGLTTGPSGWDVRVLAEEAVPAYGRVALSSCFSGRTAAELTLLPDGAFPDPAVTVSLGEQVTGVDPQERCLTTSAGRRLGYESLVLATGSRPFIPPVPGHDAPGCFVYRTLDDVAAIRAAAAGRQTGIVVGGGLLGLEAAHALVSLGLATTVVELAPRLMALQVDDGGGAQLRRHIERLGVQVRAGTATGRIITGPDGTVTGVELTDGTCVEADLVVFAAGVRPRDELARAAGLAVGERGGVLVDEACRTSDEAIFAIGECAAAGGRVYGLVAPGYAMAEVAADRLAGGEATFTTADTSTKLKLLGVDVASFGDAFATTADALELVFSDSVEGVYKKLVVTDDGKRLLGGMLVGDASAYAALRPLVGSGLPLPDDPAALILPSGQPAGHGAPLPDEAHVCSCNNVTAGCIRDSVRARGCATVAAVKTCTKAATGCGSCVPLVKSLVDAELSAAGVTPSKALCEHFDLTRQELFDLIRVQRITTFSELVAKHGRGRGCDICKPAIASILASQTDAHVLDGENAALQDTNDHVLANLQKDGSYSVVPRVPGGEITPDGLLAIGRVAKSFGLYTKITGGQRIDLFGARLDQLPAIWRELTDAGFESGHAYGKAVRTVKSCVGDTWCRYGVQDSVTLAIELELRYRGLRAPHKVKLGVSGCARECAEARSKDVGVIATEKGWNLYVGGNGGFSPRHAQLLAADLDTASLVRYVDRFLMYYVRTADRLQRTAGWIEALDGGLDHVRSVVVDDALGLAADLEADMARHVVAYRDEWRATLDDPAKLARFVAFVNAPEVSDPSLVRVAERGQTRPPRRGETATLVAGAKLPVGVP
ncbi:MAG: nitrite reductase large subunit NirB [Frankiaceae bacterium]